MFTTIKEATKELRVSERFLRQLIREGRIPSYRLSPRTLRVDLQEVRNYMRLVSKDWPKKEGIESDVR